MVKNRQTDGKFLRRQKMAFGSPILSFLVTLALWNTSLYAETKPDTLELIRAIPHSGYSEGLDFHGGFLWHTVRQGPVDNADPEKGEGIIRKINPADGTIVATYKAAARWPESLVWFNDTILNLAFQSNGIFRAKLEKNGSELNFKRVGDTPESEGWGIEYDGKNIVVTGSYSNDSLYFLNPKTFKLERKVSTTVKGLEDLGWDKTWFWASSFMEHKGEIFPIDPKTGKIPKFYQLPGEPCPIIDGIAVEKDTLWVTGKNCLSIFQYKIPKVSASDTANPVAK